jgi:GNAT superfamily N-acetyltransferase
VILIRLASEADVPALADLRRESAFERYPECEDEGFGERFAAWYEQEACRRLTWLAEDKGLAGDQGHAVGMMNFVLFERMPRPGPDPGRWGYLANAYVRPDYRNQGIGGRLLDAILAYADDRGFARVVLSPSQRSVPFYRRAGFGPADELLSRERPGG